MSDHEARIARLEAADGVRDLLWRYTNAVDGLGALEGLGDCFTADAVMANPTAYEGRDAIVEYYGAVLGAMDGAHHYVVNSQITIEGPDRARHRAYFLAFMTRDGATNVIHGAYDDVAVREADGVWRFQHKGNQLREVAPLPAPVPIEE